MSGLVPIAKFAATAVASLSVGKVIEDVIKNNTTVVTRLDQVRVTVGGFILGSMIVDKASEQLSKRWNEAAEMWKKNKDEEEDAKEEVT